jgi:transposase-like protein
VKQQSSQGRPTQRHRTRKEKAKILAAHQRSGLSLLAFAGKHGLCYSSLLRWRCRQANRANAEAPDGPQADPRFVPVQLEGEAPAEDYVLSWPSGRSLKIPQQFHRDSLLRLLSVLEEVR